MEHTTYFRGTVVEKRPAISLSTYKVFFSLPRSKENLKRPIGDTGNTVSCAKVFENYGNWCPNNSQFIHGMWGL